MSYIHPTLAKEFGEDYSKIFGPVEDREINLTSLAYDDEELDRIIKQLPNKGIINTRKRFGKRIKKIEDNPRLEKDIHRAVLRMLEQSEALLGFKLPELNLEAERKGLMQLPWEIFVVRPDVNRELDVGHILRNIISKWDIRYNDPIFARITTVDGSHIDENNWKEHLENNNLVAVANDHQHGGEGRLFMGAPYALVDPIFCNKKSTDTEMYDKRNGAMLASSWENRARNAIAVVHDKLSEGETKQSIPPYTYELYEWNEVLKKLDVDFQSSKLPKDKAICNRGKDLYKYYCTKKWKPFYEEVIAMHRRVWPEGELSQEVLWGIFTFLEFYVKEHSYTTAKCKELLKKIEIVLKAYYPDEQFPKNYRNRSTTGPSNTDPCKRTFWGDANDYRGYLEKKDGDDWRVKLDKGVQMSSTLHHMIMSYNKYLTDMNKPALLKSSIPAFTSVTGKSIGFENPFKIYKDKDVINEWSWNADEAEVDYADFENE